MRGISFAVLVRTELFKVASSRWQPVALTAVLILHVPPMLWAGQNAQATWNGLRSRSELFTAYAMMAFGVLIVAQEYRHRTAALAFLAVPGRRRITIAQYLTVAAIGLGLSAALFAGWLAVGAARCCGAFEPLLDVTRLRGPVTAPLGVLAWPTSELETGALASALGWGILALVTGLVAVGRDLSS